VNDLGEGFGKLIRVVYVMQHQETKMLMFAQEERKIQARRSKNVNG
jgi:hypothetical protein